MKKTALIICNGEVPSKRLARELVAGADIVVAADGGANVARSLGIHPDVIIGDLDSIARDTERYFSRQTNRPRPLKKFEPLSEQRPQGRGYTTFIRVERQDNTDLEKALDFLLEQQVSVATILAATGKRLDHTLGNLSVIWNYVQHLQLRFVADGWCAIPVGRRKAVTAKKGTTVSLMPFGVCSGITLRGLQFPLTNAKMRVGEIGVSNVVKRSPFTVEVKKGKMLMFVLSDHKSVCEM